VDLEQNSDPSKKADLILVTHSHSDHCDPAKIEKFRKKGALVMAPEDCASEINGGFKKLKPGEVAIVDNIKVEALHAYNIKRFRSSGIPYHPKGYGVGYLIIIDGKRIYHAGDSDFIPEMKKVGPVDVALLPIGNTYTMNVAEAAEAAIAIQPRIVIPMHRLNANPEDFKKRVEGHAGIRVALLQEGEEIQL
jgi:L-ascorbate metabolism protein UlaG (beta-lactamase superfamily)